MIDLVQLFETHPELTGYVEPWGGDVDVSVRADTKEAWEAAALSRALLYLNEDGESVPAEGANLSAIGPVTITEAVMDGETVVTPAVMDNRHHVNLRIAEPLLSKVDEDGNLLWVQTALAWIGLGADDAEQNKAEVGKKLANVTLLDRSTISSPSNVWL